MAPTPSVDYAWPSPGLDPVEDQAKPENISNSPNESTSSPSSASSTSASDQPHPTHLKQQEGPVFNKGYFEDPSSVRDIDTIPGRVSTKGYFQNLPGMAPSTSVLTSASDQPHPTHLKQQEGPVFNKGYFEDPSVLRDIDTIPGRVSTKGYFQNLPGMAPSTSVDYAWPSPGMDPVEEKVKPENSSNAPTESISSPPSASTSSSSDQPYPQHLNQQEGPVFNKGYFEDPSSVRDIDTIPGRVSTKGYFQNLPGMAPSTSVDYAWPSPGLDPVEEKAEPENSPNPPIESVSSPPSASTTSASDQPYPQHLNQQKGSELNKGYFEDPSSVRDPDTISGRVSTKGYFQNLPGMAPSTSVDYAWPSPGIDPVGEVSDIPTHSTRVKKIKEGLMKDLPKMFLISKDAKTDNIWGKTPTKQDRGGSYEGFTENVSKDAKTDNIWGKTSTKQDRGGSYEGFTENVSKDAKTDNIWGKTSTKGYFDNLPGRAPTSSPAAAPQKKGNELNTGYIEEATWNAANNIDNIPGRVSTKGYFDNLPGMASQSPPNPPPESSTGTAEVKKPIRRPRKRPPPPPPTGPPLFKTYEQGSPGMFQGFGDIFEGLPGRATSMPPPSGSSSSSSSSNSGGDNDSGTTAQSKPIRRPRKRPPPPPPTGPPLFKTYEQGGSSMFEGFGSMFDNLPGKPQAKPPRRGGGGGGNDGNSRDGKRRQ
eukprot:CAMPEP_0172520898 /NCGR_PEP_ID=MMETSP1066-20121228/292261_1 /TAXON_ID=671091 /ORGANISM="Coscinodiscus wailesii, Strain CCMP2513" /LENGTH=701 /DNA_ID=CAMNT_0013303717 /DNA_START=27 /DNA_END=2134 /DNA_ORIENTATION=-